MISIEFLLTSLIVVLIPGTGVIYTVSVAMFRGFKASWFAALGCTLGILPSLLASVLGLAAIFHSSALAFSLVKYVGVVYLVYLAVMMYKDSNTLVIGKVTNSSLVGTAIKGFLINILNPKLSIFFMAFLPQFISPQSATPIQQMFLLGGVFMLMTLVVFVLYAVLANKLATYITNSAKNVLYLQRAFAASFAGLAAKLLFTDK
jgi:threonine/homoserine/homoserine lactone efflux protein